MMIRAGWLRKATLLVTAIVVGVIAWLMRFNDPGGTYGGLTDDHFFYLVRGWQVLFGELPLRDFADQGAPLYYYLAAAVQIGFGRGTLSELVFSTTVLACCAGGVFWLAARASGSVLAGLAGVAFQVWLEPRFYNYPKFLVYVVAIPLLWRFADQPSVRVRFALAVVTVVAFLFRHDHGVFIALAVFALIAVLSDLPWHERGRHALLYALTALLLVSPYLAFVQAHVGVARYARQVVSWAERDRERGPLAWPELFEAPIPEGLDGSVVTRGVALVQANLVPSIYYFELVLPLAALALIVLSRDGFRPAWPRARVKLAVVAIVGLLLNAGFLRSPITARIADPSVPHAVLIAWLVVALPRAVFGGALRPFAQPFRWPIRVVGVASAGVIALLLWSLVSLDFRRHMERVYFTEGWRVAFGRPQATVASIREAWDIQTFVDRSPSNDFVGLSLYVNACTRPTDRVFVQAYIPQVLGLARRGFAGGHADLRPGFFATQEDQRDTLMRLRAQSVPILLLETDALENFRISFPLIIEYFDSAYVHAGTRRFDNERMGVSLYVRRDREPTGTYAPYGWPCYGSGRVQS